MFANLVQGERFVGIGCARALSGRSSVESSDLTFTCNEVIFRHLSNLQCTCTKLEISGISFRTDRSLNVTYIWGQMRVEEEATCNFTSPIE